MGMSELKRVAFVTGASRGIGRAVAERLAQQGRHMVLVSRAQGPLDELQAAIAGQGGSATTISWLPNDPAARWSGVPC